MNLLSNDSVLYKVITKSFWLYFFVFLIGPIGYVIRILITNDVRVSEIGLLYAIIGLLTIMGQFAHLGTTESLIYFLPKYRKNKEYDKLSTTIRFVLLVQCSMAILIGILYRGNIDRLATEYFSLTVANTILKIFILFFVSIVISNITNALLESIQDMFAYKAHDATKMLLILIAVSIIYILGIGNIILYAYSRIFGSLIGSIVRFGYVMRRYRSTLFAGKIRAQKETIRPFIRYSFYSLLTANAGILLSSIDLQFIQYFLTEYESGQYATFLSLRLIGFMLLGPFLGLLFPLISELHASHKEKKIMTLLEMVYKYLFIFSLSMGVFFLIFGELIAISLFGMAYAPAGNLLQILGVFLPLNTLLLINLGALGGIGETRKKFGILIGALCINCILNVILIPQVGTVGAIFSTIFGRLYAAIYSTKVIRSSYAISIPWIFWRQCCIIIIITGMLVGGVTFEFFPTYSYTRIQLFFVLLFFGLLYYFILCVIGYRQIAFFVKKVKDGLQKK